MKPAWEIDEYASIRFTSSCTSASAAPIVTVAAASTQTTGRQSSARLDIASATTRRMATNAATLPTEASSPVTGIGAP